MKLMCIDIGNTNIVAGIYNDNQLEKIQRLESSKKAIDKSLDLNLVDKIALSSVVPKIEKYIISKFTVFSVSHINSNIKLKVQVPSDVGNDRLCNMKAVIKKNEI